MRIITKRLILRPLENKDCNSLIENLNNLHVSKWLLVVPYPYKIKDAKWWVNHTKRQWKDKDKKDFNFGIELKEEKKVIGGIGLTKVDKFNGTAEVGYWLGENYWRMGYGSEALEVILKLAFNKLKLRRITAGVFEGNPSSGKLLEKFGATYEGMKRKSHRCKADGKIKSEIIYGLLKEDWKR